MISTIPDIDVVHQLALIEARENFYAFRQFINPKLNFDGWWQREVAYELQDFYDKLIAGERPRLVIEAPPQHGKSVMITDFIAWLAGKHPDTKTIYASFSERLGTRANLRLQRIYKTDIYRNIFPDTGIGKGVCNRDIIEYNDKDGYFRNTTVNGSVTGESLDLGVIDDPIKGREAANSGTVRDKTWEWFTDDFSTRFADTAGLLIILTRWHIDDPVGRLKANDPTVKVLSYPAIAVEDEQHRLKGEALFPQHKSLEFLLGVKKVMSIGSWESLYQQRPFVEEGEFFKPDNISVIDIAPVGLKFTRAWDFAATVGGGDWTVGGKMAKMADGRFLIADVRRFQGGPDEVRTALKNTADTDGRPTRIRIPQDPGQAGKDQAQSMVRLLSGYKVEAKPVTGEKTVRAEGFASQVNVGNVVMIRAPWNELLIAELRMFPNGPNDDQVDALSDAFNDVAEVPDVLNMWAKLSK